MTQITAIITFSFCLLLMGVLTLLLRSVQDIRGYRSKIQDKESSFKLSKTLMLIIFTLVSITSASVYLSQWIYPNDMGGYHLHGLFAAAVLGVLSANVSSKSGSQFLATFLPIIPNFMMIDSLESFFFIPVIVYMPFLMGLLSIGLHYILPRIGIIERMEESISKAADAKVIEIIRSI